MKGLYSVLPRLWTNMATLLGTVIVVVSGCSLLLALAVDIVSPFSSQYSATAAFLLLPLCLTLGLFMIFVGLLLDRRRSRKGAKTSTIPSQIFESIMGDEQLKRKVFFATSSTLICIVILGAGGMKGLVFMDSPEFCGTVCHTVMQPEYDSYLASPHSRIPCVDCHIGPGATSAVKSKIDGSRQVLAVLTNSYPTPIPSPVQDLRPSRHTCEQCHWPQKFHGNSMRHFTHYAEDETNSAEVDVLVLRVGGIDPKTKKYHGIHWHVSSDVEIEYESLDEKREKIGKIVVREKGEAATVQREYNLPGSEKQNNHDTRVMDCVDCHNRPTHIFDYSPEHAVDRGITEGLIDPSIPFIKKIGTAAISRRDHPFDKLEESIRWSLDKLYDAHYAEKKPSDTQLNASAKGLAVLYKRNIFPKMNVVWDTHTSHLGHLGEDRDLRGCFRCHDGKHVTDDGKLLSQDCDLCHEILNVDDATEDLPDSIRSWIELSN